MPAIQVFGLVSIWRLVAITASVLMVSGMTHVSGPGGATGRTSCWDALGKIERFTAYGDSRNSQANVSCYQAAGRRNGLP